MDVSAVAHDGQVVFAVHAMQEILIVKHSLRLPDALGVQELVRHTRDALPAEEFGALRRGVLGALEARSRELAEEGSTRCLYCIHLVFNMAGASLGFVNP